MTKQYIENQQNADKIRSSLIKKTNPILQTNHSYNNIKLAPETIRYNTKTKPIDDLNRKPLRKQGQLCTNASAVFSSHQFSIEETRRRDLKSQYKAKNHQIRINKIKTLNSPAKEDHLEANLIPLSSLSPVNNPHLLKRISSNVK